MDSDTSDYESGVLIDQYTSDLNLIVDKECLLAYPIAGDGFCSMWAGCRANSGIDHDKVAFEINIEDYCECPDVPKCSEAEPHMFRVGWSVIESSMQLGENKYSFAYCNNGKKCTDKVFEDYGETFQKGDSVASYIDFVTDPTKIIISYSKNGIDMGQAFSINKSDLMESHILEFPNKKRFNLDLEKAENQQKIESKSLVLFPHVLSKNIVFEMNFGQRVSLIGDEPFAPIKNGFQLIQKIPIENRFCSEVNQKSREDLETLMLIGLPGIGKTKWAEEYSKSNPEKQFSIVGISSILEKMKDVDKKIEPVNSNLKGGKDAEETEKAENKDAKAEENNSTTKVSSSQVVVAKSQMELLDKALKCMNILMDIAAQSNRNIIIDQPNVYESTRNRKMKLFEKYKRRAVVLISSCSDYQELVAKNENANESYMILVNDMKANFTLPKVGAVFQSVEYVNMDEMKAEQLVQDYNKEGAENRLNIIIEKRNQKKLTSKQTASRALSNPLAAGGLHNKFGTNPYPYQVPFPSQMPMYGNDMGARSRFGLNQINSNKRFINSGYYNQQIRMDVNNPFPPTMINPMIPNYMRPPMFINHVFPPTIGMPPNYNLIAHQQQQQQRHIASYGLNHSWPAATSTEIWNQSNQRMAAASSNWAPALPVSQTAQQPGLMLNRPPTSSGSQWPTGNNGNAAMVDAWPSANQPN